jgi:hypothetical protein
MPSPLEKSRFYKIGPMEIFKILAYRMLESNVFSVKFLQLPSKMSAPTRRDEPIKMSSTSKVRVGYLDHMLYQSRL